MEHCSVGSILNLKCGPAGRDNKKIDIDDSHIGQVELPRIRSKLSLSWMLLMYAQSTSYSSLITFHMYIVINVLIHSVCIKV